MYMWPSDHRLVGGMTYRRGGDTEVTERSKGRWHGVGYGDSTETKQNTVPTQLGGKRGRKKNGHLDEGTAIRQQKHHSNTIATQCRWRDSVTVKKRVTSRQQHAEDTPAF